MIRCDPSACHHRRERVFLFGYAQGGTAALDLLRRLGSRRLGGLVSWCGHALSPPANARSAHGTEAATAVAAGAAGAAVGVAVSPGAAGIPVLVVGGDGDERTPPAAAHQLFRTMTAAWRDVESPAEQKLHILPARGDAMVSNAPEARLLMEFFAKHLALSTALEDDPSIVRVS